MFPRTHLLLVSVLVSLWFTACGEQERLPSEENGVSDSSSKVADNTTRSSIRATDTVVDKPLRFGPASGTIAMRTTATTDEKITEIHYFDRHGERQAIHTDIVAIVDGKKLTISNVNIIQDGMGVLYDPKRKVGMRNPLASGSLGNLPDFAQLTPERKQALSYKPIEPKTVVGRNCQGHSFSRNGLSMRVWTWEGVPLHIEVDYGPGTRTVTEATSIDTGTVIPESLFTVPEDIRFDEK